MSNRELFSKEALRLLAEYREREEKWKAGGYFGNNAHPDENRRFLVEAQVWATLALAEKED